MSPKPASDSYPALANLSHGVPSPAQKEAALALGEIDKWRIRDAEDEACWQIEMQADDV